MTGLFLGWNDLDRAGALYFLAAATSAVRDTAVSRIHRPWRRMTTPLFAPYSALGPIVRRPQTTDRRQIGAFIDVQRSTVGRLRAGVRSSDGRARLRSGAQVLLDCFVAA